ncbi:MAG TPA: hypothetical protein VF503_08520 [Sphingobium sp.]|uniref:hypothetical protein n=1 Tax=Sphingobium sp. TaxID=1912891 RepID=UPI002ED53808
MAQTESVTELLERARMHEQLAAATGDSAARTIHHAMAAEYRRRATDGAEIVHPAPPASNPRLEIYSAPL